MKRINYILASIKQNSAYNWCVSYYTRGGLSRNYKTSIKRQKLFKQ